eukprot:TRINITY_DN31054_c0_g1_i1.p1 TRINITY_DN31054_c0_g1~~TRINITY_DN31054_c0_g1_i1.p1  ORF type:complete len:146 (-),score=23.44 TRINITY_DN31054_c0_g1_i1:12-449(-)
MVEAASSRAWLQSCSDTGLIDHKLATFEDLQHLIISTAARIPSMDTSNLPGAICDYLTSCGVHHEVKYNADEGVAELYLNNVHFNLSSSAQERERGAKGQAEAIKKVYWQFAFELNHNLNLQETLPKLKVLNQEEMDIIMSMKII